MILELIEGVDKLSNEYFSDILNKHGDENIAWYPSSGVDFRLLSETSRTSTEPSIFFFTDYNTNWVKLNKGEIFNDGKSSVRINEIQRLKFKRDINYYINPEFVDFPNDAPKIPIILLLDVTVVSDLGNVTKPVIYFFMENINFFTEVLLRYNINLSHFVKIREGCSYGGNRKSISLIYPFLGNLKTKHIIVDNSVNIDYELVDEIKKRSKLFPVKYKLENTPKLRIFDWSGLLVQVFNVVVFQKCLMRDDDLKEIVTKIKRGHGH